MTTTLYRTVARTPGASVFFDHGRRLDAERAAVGWGQVGWNAWVEEIHAPPDDAAQWTVAPPRAMAYISQSRAAVAAVASCGIVQAGLAARD